MNRRDGEARHPISAEEFRLLRDLVYEHAGLRFEEDAMMLFERRLSDRVAALGFSSFNPYYKYLRFNPLGGSELEEVVERLTTKETYFFRQEYQLRAFKDELLPRIANSNREHRRLSVWSAGCATGEEAYTLAMLILESGLFVGWDVRVIGSDISKRGVAHARRGVYRPSSFRVTSPAQRERFFREAADGSHVVDDVKKLCHFAQLN